jgi:hypothetical protein
MGGVQYTDELSNEIVERLCNGEPLRQICRDDHMPSWRSVYNWIKEKEEFASRIAHARDLGYDAIAEDCLSIADNQEEGTKTVTDHNGTKIETPDMIAHRKLKIETRLKLLSKWNPKKYGDRINTDLTSNGEKLEQVFVIGGKEIKFE